MLFAPTPTTNGRLAAEPHWRCVLVHDEAALPWLEFIKRDAFPLRRAHIRAGVSHHAELAVKLRGAYLAVRAPAWLILG